MFTVSKSALSLKIISPPNKYPKWTKISKNFILSLTGNRPLEDSKTAHTERLLHSCHLNVV